MQIHSDVRKVLVDPVLRRNLSAAVDDFVLDTADGPIPLIASIRCEGDADEIRLELRDSEARDLRKFFPAKNHFGRGDTLSATGTLAGKLRIKLVEIWPPAKTCSTHTRTLQTSSATVKVSQIEVEPELRTRDSESPGSIEFEHLFILANTKLEFRNTAQNRTVAHPFWGTSSETATVSWDGTAFDGSFSIIQDEEHLKVGFRHQASTIEEAKSRADALLSAIGYALAINPWPSYVRVSASGQRIEEAVRSLDPAQGKMVPLRERQAVENPDAPTNLIASVAEWIHALSPEEREDVTHALWVFRSADHRAAPAPVKLAMIGAIIEGLFTASQTEILPSEFTDLRNEAVGWANDVAAKSCNPERSALAKRLANYLRNWSYLDRRTAWKMAFAPLFPANDAWLNEMFDLFQKRRNSPAHGDFVASMNSDSHKLISDLGRLAGFVNLVIAAKAGYRGPILASTYDDEVIMLKPSIVTNSQPS